MLGIAVIPAIGKQGQEIGLYLAAQTRIERGTLKIVHVEGKPQGYGEAWVTAHEKWGKDRHYDAR